MTALIAIATFILGLATGITVMACCAAAGRADEAQEGMHEQRD
jgi:hypothetical protein